MGWEEREACLPGHRAAVVFRLLHTHRIRSEDVDPQ